MFSQEGNNPFVLFSLTHILTLSFFLVACSVLYLFRRFLRRELPNKIFRFGFAAFLLSSEISLVWWLNHINAWSIQHSLPLHLSSLSLLLSSLLLLTRSYKLFEFTYFVGVGSAIQAMITPDIQAYNFPHFRYVHFFLSHGGIVIANMFMIVVEECRPSLPSLFRAFLYLNGYTLFIFLVNLVIKGNYMYIMKKPVNPSVFDYLGPWPLYIIPLEILALVTFFILYFPFYMVNRFKLRS